MALGESAGILFRIKADGSQAQRELRGIIGNVSGLGDEFAAMAGPAGIAAAVVAAVGAAAVVAGVALVKLAFNASEYGSAIFDAQEKSGLTAATLSTLKVAADASGSSFESITGSVSKFTVLLGQANQGNEKAIATLEKYGITARDVNGALEQAVAAIGSERDATLQAAAAKDLFKDKSGALIPVIKQLGGDLRKATEDAKRLGLVLGEDDVRAADDLGDAFGVLSAQVKAGAARFALQYAPQITAAIKTISDFLANNSGEWAKWGRFVYDAVSGAWLILQAFGTAANNILAAVTLGLSNQVGAWNIWATAARVAIAIVTGGLSEIILMLERIGALTNGSNGSGQGQWLSPLPTSNIPSMPKMPKMPKVSGGGGGGESAADKAAREAEKAAQEAERQRQKEVAAAQRAMAETLAIYKEGYDKRVAALEQSLSLGHILEIEYVRDVARIRWEAIKDEMTLNKELLRNDKLNGDEKAEIQQKLKVLAIQLDIAKLKTSKELNEQVKKEIADKEVLLDKEKAILEAERKRRNERKKAGDQAAIDEDRAQQAQLLKDTNSAGIGSGFFEGISNAIDIMVSKTLDAKDKMASAAQQIAGSWQSMGDVIAGAVNSFAQGVGNIVQNLVLMGDAGPNAMRKLVASVLAGVAAQAAVLAVFELAKGFAALFFNPAEANAHFIAAALFGGIAVGTGLVGRAIAGDSFKQASSSATGSSSGGGGGSNGSSQELRYTTPFQGYGQNNGQSNLLVRTLDRINTTLGLVEETQNTFNERVTTMRPDEVVRMGAIGAARELTDAVAESLDSSSTDRMMRGLGRA